MTSSGGRDPVFENTQLWAHWEFSINNSSKKCGGGTSFNYFFFQFQIFGSMCLSLAWFPRGSSFPEAPVKMINSFPTAPSLPHPRRSRNTWLSQKRGFWVYSGCLLGLEGNSVLQNPMGRERQSREMFWLRTSTQLSDGKAWTSSVITCCGPLSCLVINPGDQVCLKLDTTSYLGSIFKSFNREVEGDDFFCQTWTIRL